MNIDRSSHIWKALFYFRPFWESQAGSAQQLDLFLKKLGLENSEPTPFTEAHQDILQSLFDFKIIQSSTAIRSPFTQTSNDVFFSIGEAFLEGKSFHEPKQGPMPASASKASTAQHWNAFTESCFQGQNSDSPSPDWILDCIQRYFLFHALDQEPHVHSVAVASKLSLALMESLLQMDIEQLQQPSFRIQAIDLSGIQRFLYQISTKHAVKALKGRSFYLQILSEGVALCLLHDLNLGQAQLIFKGGGKLFLLLPNNDATQKACHRIQEEAEKSLWQEWQGTLALVWAHCSWNFNRDGKEWLNKDTEEPMSQTQVWKEISAALSEEKKRKFSRMVENPTLWNNLFQPAGEGGDTAVCQITGVELPKKNLVSLPESQDSPIFISPAVQNQINVGKKLSKSPLLHYTFRPEEENCDLKLGNVFGIRLFETSSISNNIKGERGCWFALNPKAQNQALMKGFQVLLKPYGGSRQALNPKGHPKTTEEFYSGEAFARIGLLRMDIDSLGHYIVHKMKPSQKTLEGMSFFSQCLDYFMTFCVDQIRNKEIYSDNVNIIYSGGDDLFAYGEPEALISFAECCSSSFKGFTQGSGMSLSGGIVETDPKFPIAKGAELCELAELSAKSLKSLKADGSEHNKDSICIFGKAIHWGEEFKLVKNLKSYLTEACTKEELPRGILQRLKRFDKNHGEGYQKYRWKWQAAYELKRLKENYKGKSNTQKRLADIEALLLQRKDMQDRHVPEGRNFIWLAAQWTEKRTRTKSN